VTGWTGVGLATGATGWVGGIPDTWGGVAAGPPKLLSGRGNPELVGMPATPPSATLLNSFWIIAAPI
jgi:hypothetical protein